MAINDNSKRGHAGPSPFSPKWTPMPKDSSLEPDAGALQRPILVHTHRTLSPTIIAVQIRLKSKKSNFKRSSSSPPPPNPTPSVNSQSASSPLPIRPIRPRKTVDVIYEKPTALYSIIVDLKDWRHSRLLLTVVVNSTAFIVFCLWTLEAHKAAKGKKKLENNEPNSSDDSSDDSSAGKFVPGTTTEMRFVTPGQEWLLDNFTVTPLNFREGRYWTYFTSLFSHQLPAHTFFNMMASHFLFTGLALLAPSLLQQPSSSGRHSKHDHGSVDGQTWKHQL